MEPSAPSIRQTSLCLPFESEAHYRTCMEDLAVYRQHIDKLRAAHPELFPKVMSAGYHFHSQYHSVKQSLRLRRIKLKATAQVYGIRPSFMLPYMVGRTDALEKALRLRRWGVPFEELAYQFGRDPMYYYRAWVSFGRVALVGTTVKTAAKLPAHLVADEKHTWMQGEKVYLATTAAHGCLLGASLAAEASADALEKAYGEFATEARQVQPDYTPQTVNTDGFHSTREAWTRLFQTITLILCFLHSVLKIRERCRKALRQQLLDQAWHVYQAKTQAQFSQRVRRLREWAQAHLDPGPVQEAVLKLCQRRADFLLAYAFPGAARTSNTVDRLLNYMDRVLYSMSYFHGTPATARLAVRAMALQWNFHSYGVRTQRASPGRASPFADLNGFQYHSNWLHNLLIAASMGGRRL